MGSRPAIELRRVAWPAAISGTMSLSKAAVVFAAAVMESASTLASSRCANSCGVLPGMRSHAGTCSRVLAPRATVVCGPRENRNQEGTHRFYRFRTAAVCRMHRFYRLNSAAARPTHRFYRMPPFLSTKSNGNITGIWGPDGAVACRLRRRHI